MTKLNKTILLADDDLDDQEILIEIFAQLDKHVQVDTVTNGNQVLKYLSERKAQEFPALIVMDFKMPFLNAAEVLEKLSGDTRYAAIPKVVWSTSQQDMIRCMNAGAKSYYIKPTKASELKLIAGKMLQQSY